LIGGKRTLLVVFAISGLALIVHGLSPSLTVLVLAALIFGAGQAGANPSTNALIGGLLEPGRRGVTTGIKQSGVQLGIFLGGLILPTASAVIGWRWTLIVAGLVPLIWLVVAVIAIPHPLRLLDNRGTDASGNHPAIKGIGVYALFMGMGGGSLLAYLALFAYESLGYSLVDAGLAVALGGITAVVARVLWGKQSEQSGRYADLLRLLAVLAAVSVLVLWVSLLQAPWLLWPATVLLGASSGSFNAPAMVAVISLSSERNRGHASGLVMLGFSAGSAIGPPIFGYTIDSTRDYEAGLAFSGAAYVLAAVVASRWAESANRANRIRVPD
jgi:MFS family permease